MKKNCILIIAVLCSYLVHGQWEYRTIPMIEYNLQPYISAGSNEIIQIYEPSASKKYISADYGNTWQIDPDYSLPSISFIHDGLPMERDDVIGVVGLNGEIIFDDPTNIYFVYDEVVFAKSIDKGQNYEYMNLRGLEGVPNEDIEIIGYCGYQSDNYVAVWHLDQLILYKSTDEGDTWEQISININDILDSNEVEIISTSNYKSGMEFVNESIGFMYFDVFTTENYLYSMSLLTSDGGHNWDYIRVETDGNGPLNGYETVDNVYFVNKNIGFAFLHSNYDLYRTSDGGTTWTNIPNSSLGLDSDYAFREFHFINEMEGWLTGGVCCNNPGNFILHTLDAGESWNLEFKDKTDLLTNTLIEEDFGEEFYSITSSGNHLYVSNEHNVLEREIDSVLGTNDTEINGSFWVFVDDNDDILINSSSPASHSQHFRVYDMNGRVASSGIIPAHTTSFRHSANDLDNGMYLVKIDQRIARKIVIVK